MQICVPGLQKRLGNTMGKEWWHIIENGTFHKSLKYWMRNPDICHFFHRSLGYLYYFHFADSFHGWNLLQVDGMIILLLWYFALTRRVTGNTNLTSCLFRILYAWSFINNIVFWYVIYFGKCLIVFVENFNYFNEVA